MTLGELYLKDILRPPPTGTIPPNVPHPYQTSLYTYVSKKLIPKHWFVLAGFSFTLTMYGLLDSAKDGIKKKNYDDAVAAGRPPCHSPRVQLLGISTVGGNQSLAKVTQNALDVLSAVGLGHIGVVAGQHKPLLRQAKLCPEIHGDSGLDGPQGGRLLPLSTDAPLSGKAVNVMYEAMARQRLLVPDGERIRLVCTGALTNAAVLLTVYPEVLGWIEIVLMGGCLGVGNTGPVMEFNIQTDPEAAKLVFESGVALTMVPLEVTHTLLVTPSILAAITGRPPATPFREAVAQLLLFFAETYRTVFSFEHPPLHDPCAVAYVIAPEMFEVKQLRVDVEVVSALSAGQTVVDIWGQSGLPANATVALKANVDGVWLLLLEAISAADQASPLNRRVNADQ